MGDADISASQWRLVEVGRVVLFATGPYAGRLAAIVEIIDHKRVLVDGPSETKPVPRHSAPLSDTQLTSLVIEKLPRAIGNAALKGKWQKAEVEKKFAESAWAQNREKSAKRKSLNDYERFKVMRLRKQKRYQERKEMAKIKASA